jgi:hypothetical protein
VCEAVELVSFGHEESAEVLTDEQWELIEPLFPKAKFQRGRLSEQ